MLNRQEHGFTLIEVLIALVVLSVAIGGALVVMGGATESQLKVDRTQFLNTASEQAWDRLVGESPWLSSSNRCLPSCSNGSPSYNTTSNPYVVRKDRYVAVSQYTVRRQGSAPRWLYNVSVITTLWDSASGQKVKDSATGSYYTRTIAGNNPTLDGSGTLTVNVCTVNQMDERMSFSSSVCYGTTRRMAWEDGGSGPAWCNPAVSLPTGENYSSNKACYQWNNPASQPYQNVTTTAVGYTIRVNGSYYPGNSADARAVNQVYSSSQGSSQVIIPNLPEGDYRVTITSGTLASYSFWGSKSSYLADYSSSVGSSNNYFLARVTEGGQEVKLIVFKPNPVPVTMQIKTFDGTFPWRPHWFRKFASQPPWIRNQTVTLLPFPSGRTGNVNLPTAAVKSCNYDESGGAAGCGYAGNLTFQNVEPGLYQAAVYRQFENHGTGSNAGITSTFRPITRGDLGLPLLGCCVPFSWSLMGPTDKVRYGGTSTNSGSNGLGFYTGTEKSQLDFIYVRPDGSVVSAPQSAQVPGYNQPSIALPHCSTLHRSALEKMVLGGMDGNGQAYGPGAKNWAGHWSNTKPGWWVHDSWNFQDRGMEWVYVNAPLNPSVDGSPDIGWVRLVGLAPWVSAQQSILTKHGLTNSFEGGGPPNGYSIWEAARGGPGDVTNNPSGGWNSDWSLIHSRTRGWSTSWETERWNGPPGSNGRHPNPIHKIMDPATGQAMKFILTTCSLDPASLPDGIAG